MCCEQDNFKDKSLIFAFVMFLTNGQISNMHKMISVQSWDANCLINGMQDMLCATGDGFRS